MLLVYRSNRLEALAGRLAEVARQRAPLEAFRVVVQHAGMGRWLHMYVATQEGVCANLHWQFPAAFVWELLHGGQQGSAYRYTQQSLCWRLLGQLDQVAELADYLHSAGRAARYELAAHLAQVFDRYLVYRPDWILDWEAGQEEHWQAQLWRRLGEGEHWVRAVQRFREGLQAGQQQALPTQACLFGVPTLSPGYLQVLQLLSRHMNIHLFLLDPCREYWGDLESPAHVAKAVMEERPGAGLMQVGNRLLAAMGRQGRDFLDAVHGLEPDREEDLFEVPGRADRLHCLQTDLLELRQDGGVFAEPDPSVQVHACHSPMRELEVLHDRLLAMFEYWPELRPSDVVVMAPDLDLYAPLIEAVFDTAEPRIPYAIADRLRQLPGAEALLQLLELPQSRFEVEAILELLARPAVRGRVDISEEQLQRLRQWLGQAGVCWAVDQHHRGELGLPEEQTNSWRQGLERLLLGCALPDTGEPYAGLLPCGELEGEAVWLLGQLCSFMEALFELRTRLQQQGTAELHVWWQILSDIMQQFLVDTDALRDCIRQWFDAAAGSPAVPLLSLEELRAGLHAQLSADRSGGRWLGAGVSFCRMVPMRSVPFAVVCLLGLNFDAYPRLHRPVDFDLSARSRRRGDRHQRDDDRYLFLEALLSARKCLYISYAGRDLHDDSMRPPSVVVSELLVMLSRHYGVADVADMQGGALLRQHPLQPFSARYFDGRDPELYSYSEAALHSALAMHSAVAAETVFVQGEFAAQVAHELAAMERFYAGPARYFLQHCLQIYAPERVQQLDNDERFVLAGRDSVQLRKHMLEAALCGRQPSTVQVAGLLPHADAGAAVVHQEQRWVQGFMEALHPQERVQSLTALEFSLSVGGIRLQGCLPRLSSAGAIYLLTGRLWDSELLVIWLRHLVLCLQHPPDIMPQTRVVYAGEGERPLRHILPCVADAEGLLESWVHYYLQGCRQPLKFFPRTSMACAKALHKGHAEPLYVARMKWQEDTGEGHDFYNRLAFRGQPEPLDADFLHSAGTLLVPLFKSLDT